MATELVEKKGGEDLMWIAGRGNKDEMGIC